MDKSYYTFDISTNAVAWYAEIIATIGAIISVLNFFRDRARVVIKYQKDMIIHGQQSVYKKDKTYFVIKSYYYIQLQGIKDNVSF